MRVIRCAHAGCDAEGTLPVPQMSPADLVMAVELQQAKTEMEDCYRRRARRVGLEDTLPQGRSMTEQEIEDLQWQLGDFGPTGGLRAD